MNLSEIDWIFSHGITIRKAGMNCSSIKSKIIQNGNKNISLAIFLILSTMFVSLVLLTHLPRGNNHEALGLFSAIGNDAPLRKVAGLASQKELS
jgi:hypothetical protein